MADLPILGYKRHPLPVLTKPTKVKANPNPNHVYPGKTGYKMTHRKSIWLMNFSVLRTP